MPAIGSGWRGVRGGSGEEYLDVATIGTTHREPTACSSITDRDAGRLQLPDKRTGSAGNDLQATVGRLTVIAVELEADELRDGARLGDLAGSPLLVGAKPQDEPRNRVKRSATASTRMLLPLVAASLALLAFFQPQSAQADKSRDCGAVRGSEFSAERTRARNVGCTRARRVARGYLRFNEVSGWRCRTEPSGRRICRRGCKAVAFRLVGEGIIDKAERTIRQPGE